MGAFGTRCMMLFADGSPCIAPSPWKCGGDQQEFLSCAIVAYRATAHGPGESPTHHVATTVLLHKWAQGTLVLGG